MTGTLRLRARGTAHVQDHEALASSPFIRRFIGRRICEVVAAVGPEGTKDHQPARHAFVDMEEVVDKSAASEHAHLYLEDIVCGALWAADAETAALAEDFRKHRHPTRAAVKFDPTFGGEQPGPAAKSAQVAPAAAPTASPPAPKAS